VESLQSGKWMKIPKTASLPLGQDRNFSIRAMANGRGCL